MMSGNSFAMGGKSFFMDFLAWFTPFLFSSSDAYTGEEEVHPVAVKRMLKIKYKNKANNSRVHIARYRPIRGLLPKTHLSTWTSQGRVGTKPAGGVLVSVVFPKLK